MKQVALALAVLFTGAPVANAQVLDVWKTGKAAFGVYAPNENPNQQRGPGGPPPVYTEAGGEKLAMNPLYDYVFLNLEGAYDPAAVKAMSKGLHSA